jgi:hypothetical protein
MSCGTPVAGTAPGAPAPPAPLPSAPPSSPAAGAAPSLDLGPAAPAAAAPAGPPLSVQLGLSTSRKFLLQHVLIGAKHSYRVLDAEKRHLASFGENVRAERGAALQQLFHPTQLPPGTHFQASWGSLAVDHLSYWVIDDAQGAVRGTVTLEQRGGHGVATVFEPGGAAAFQVQTNRSGFSGLNASVAAPDGRPMLEARGSLMHHEFAIHDGSGAEVAKVHEAWASMRDTYSVDLTGGADPLGVLMLAVVIDHAKGH